MFLHFEYILFLLAYHFLSLYDFFLMLEFQILKSFLGWLCLIFVILLLKVPPYMMNDSYYLKFVYVAMFGNIHCHFHQTWMWILFHPSYTTYPPKRDTLVSVLTMKPESFKKLEIILLVFVCTKSKRKSPLRRGRHLSLEKNMTRTPYHTRAGEK